ncbi:hypothetical protein [Mycobacterium sp. ITM-2016-00318]|uniref:CDGP domain-containing protein n=1 Tax=Mycobacterium sp. ITM-2016-00318 TaxID=2099693 RepID=UPI000CF9D15A|nr:hypothetical protein [Mycobacterium sp. ITM-2016-00318]WNG93682.1 hypothetical protein C6A82_004220 [Mycobacterium sp. ITM-2016-00318]
MKRKVVALATALAASDVAFAAPADAGCESRPMVSYCDGPIQPDGSWQRCFSNSPVWGGGGGWIAGSNCYRTGPGPDNYPWAPQYHIDP